MQKNRSVCWALSIPRAQEVILRDYLGATVDLINWSSGLYPGKKEIDKKSPILIFSSPDSESFIERSLSLDHKKAIASLPRAIILPNDYNAIDMDIAISAKSMEILKPDFSKKELWNLILKAHESQNIHHNIQSMTRELILDRELLQQKNELLNFLVTFFSSTVQDMDYASILSKAFKAFTILLPVESMHAVLWYKNRFQQDEAQFFLNADEDSVEKILWKEVLVKEMSKARKENTCLLPAGEFKLSIEEGKKLRPEKTHYYSLPINSNENLSGIIVFAGNTMKNLGRDQTKSLLLALEHLGKVLGNSLLFKRARKEADIDALTSLYNRRHFEQRIKDEMERSLRYKQPLALLMMDIDHFKKVNDSLGHQAGDIVLKEMAKVLKRELRGSDYCARYGGEEFSVLMPTTEEDEAFMVAERLRLAIATHSFPMQLPGGRLTISIGLAHINEKNFRSIRSFVNLADERLYQAKDEGRNRTSAGKIEALAKQVI